MSNYPHVFFADPSGSWGEMLIRTEEKIIIMGKNDFPGNKEGAIFHIALSERLELVESQLAEFMNLKEQRQNVVQLENMVNFERT